MHCRSYYLLEKEYMELQEQELFGITVTPLTDDLLKWIAEIEGLKHTDWEGFTFPLILQFSVKYNSVPPVVTFSCIPFHPNVDPISGRPCIDFLDNPDLWDKNYTLSSILLSIQVMLSNPTVNNAVNSEAARMMIESNKLFREVALKSIYESYNLDEETEEETSFSVESVEETIPPLREKNIKGVSFDEYYRTWSGIATSQTDNCFKIPVTHDITGSYQKWKKSSIKPDWDAKFHSVMNRIARENRLPSRLDRSFIQSIKNAQFNTSETNMNFMDLESKEDDDSKSWKSKEKKKKNTSSKESDDMDEAWENEVENLVAWTNKLNATTLED